MSVWLIAVLARPSQPASDRSRGPAGRPGRARIAAGVALSAGAVLGLLLPASAAAFGTVSSSVPLLGQNREHERITRAALACAPDTKSDGQCFEPNSIDALAGTPGRHEPDAPEGSPRLGSFGGVGEPDAFLVRPKQALEFIARHPELVRRFPKIGLTLAVAPQPAAAKAHCDDADYLKPGYRKRRYPQSRKDAIKALMECIAHLRGRAVESEEQARHMFVRGQHVLDGSQTELGCPFLQFSVFGSAKCRAILHFGQVLHGVQDFYAHSNYGDIARGKIDHHNPPGLNRRDRPAFLDLRTSVAGIRAMLSQRVDAAGGDLHELATGCFSPEELVYKRTVLCSSRIRHAYLNKDKGEIDKVTGAATTTTHTPSRGLVEANFAQAVRDAIAETKLQWDRLRRQIVDGDPRNGGLLVCALTRDKPIEDCQGRDLAIVVDSSGSNTETDPQFLRVAAAQQFNATLVSAAQAGPGGRPDRSAVIEFDDTARVISPLGDPPAARFDGIDASGGTAIGRGLQTALDVLTAGANPVDGRAGIIVLTDGQDGSPGLQQAALDTAKALGVRVSFGFLQPPANPVSRGAGRAVPRQLSTPTAASLDLIRRIDATGGVYSTIDSATAQRSFVELVNSNGAANLDDASGADDDGTLAPGLTRAARIATPQDSDRFTFVGERGRRITVTARPLEGQPLSVAAIGLLTGSSVVASRTSSAGVVSLVIRPLKTSRLELSVSSPGASGLYEIGLAVEGVTLRGNKRSNRLSCRSAVPTLVLALAGRDKVSCSGGDDMIFGGPGTDAIVGGKGDDVFVLGSRDAGGGTEKVNGGSGRDVAVFSFPRPKGVRRRGDVTDVPTRGGRFRLKNVERLLFSSRGSAQPVAVTAKGQTPVPRSSGGSRGCGTRAGFEVSVNSRTTCQFALRVAAAVAKGARRPKVYSPVTKRSYRMTCRSRGSRSFVCTGGDRAYVALTRR